MEPIVAELVVNEDGSQELYFSHGCSDGSYTRDRLPLHRTFGWEIVQTTPLTVSPSIHCTVCGTHGYVREGLWVET